jgi:transcription initiation factor TFIID subunit 1
LQYSTDEEDYDNSQLDQQTANFGQNMGREVNFGSGIDDSQQAAEAMVQLSGFYAQPQQQDQDESIDFDPNYDPSDFLMKKVAADDQQQQQQQQFSYQQESYENLQAGELVESQQQNYYSASYSQGANMQEQIQEVEMQEQQMQQQEIQHSADVSGGGLEDLEISDSDEEESKIEISQNTSKEDEDLWF